MSDSDRQVVQNEIGELKEEVDRIANTTSFNDFIFPLLSVEIDSSGNMTGINTDPIYQSGRLGNLNWDFRPHIDLSSIEDKFLFFEYNFEYLGLSRTHHLNPQSNPYLDADDLLNMITTYGLSINAGDTVTVFHKTDQRVTASNNHDGHIYAQNNTTGQFVVLGLNTYNFTGTGSSNNSPNNFVETHMRYSMGTSYQSPNEGHLFHTIYNIKPGVTITNAEVENVFDNRNNFSFQFTFTDSNNTTDNSSGISGSSVHENKHPCNIWIQCSDESSDRIGISLVDASSSGIGIDSANVTTAEGASTTIGLVGKALSKVGEYRSYFGAIQNRLEHAYNINLNSSENTQNAESRIRDTDMAKEMVTYSKENILQQTGQSILSQSNKANEGVLTLLQ
ncbi:MAG: hypothetical protein K6G84_15540 [Lachnospiraceae bacterium]|nr:hypothetical protein [Lachnospiraceae bacterium]